MMINNQEDHWRDLCNIEPTGRQITSKKERARRANCKRGRRRCGGTAFDWLAYENRCASLRLLRVNRIHVDTTIVTRDNYVDQVHWQAISALCPALIERSRVKYDHYCQPPPTQAVPPPPAHPHPPPPTTKLSYTIVLPRQISGPMARLLVECAYGMEHISIDRSNLDEFYKICTKFNITHGLTVCLNYAASLVDVHNCVYMFRLSLLHRHHKLRRASYSMMRSSFKLILHINTDIHKLGFVHLKRLLQDNYLKLNEDEELAWLAIVRWLSRVPLTQERLANLYNQMVARAQDVHVLNLFQNSAPLQMNQQQQQQQPQQDSRNHQAMLQSEQISLPPIRVLLNFYSPSNPIGGEISNAERLRSSPAGRACCSPLRFAADKMAKQSPGALSSREEQLYSLVKCLRFMRFKSVNAFDVILTCPSVIKSDKVTALVKYMRIRYKLRHKLLLTSEEKLAIDSDELNRIKYQEESSKRKRAIKLISKFIKTPGPITRRTTSTLHHPIGVQLQQQQQPEVNPCSSKCEQLLGVKSVSRASEPRIPSSIGLLIGGWQDGSISKTIWAYDFVYDKWFKLNIRLPEARALHASCSSPTSGHVYIFGGTNGDEILNSVWRFNPQSDVQLQPAEINSLRRLALNRRRRRQANTKCKTAPPLNTTSQPNGNTKTNYGKKSFTKFLGATSSSCTKRLVYRFKQLCPMNERRCHLSGVYHSDGRLYALGGHNGQQRLRSGEWYDTKCNQWHPIADMTIARSDAAACSHDNKIFIAGGLISDQFIQSSVEFYKSSDNTWTFAAPMIIPRMSFCLASYKGHLLAIGGTNGLLVGDEVATITRSVERYNHQASSWSFCAPLGQKRCSFGTMLIENKLMVIGGHSGRRRLKTCESLRIGHFNTFTQHSGGIDTPRSVPLRMSAPPVASSGAASGLAAQTIKTSIATPATALAVGPSIEARNRSTDPGTTPAIASNPRQFDANQAHNASALVNLRSLIGTNSARIGQLTVRSSMKWIKKAELPERRSGFSIAVVQRLNNAKDYTYFGSLTPNEQQQQRVNSGEPSKWRPSLIRQPGRWHKFKIIKRRKLVKHLKIALVVTIVILMM